MKRFRWQAEWAWLAAVLGLLVLSYCWVPARDSSELDTFSTAAGGKRAFFALVEKLTPPASRSLESLYIDADHADTICILGPARYPDTNEWAWLADWVSAGNSLVFAARQSDPAVELKYFGIRVVPNKQFGEQRKRGGEHDAEQEPSADDAAQDPAQTESDGSDLEIQDGAASPNSPEQSRHTRKSMFPQPDLLTPLASGTFQWQTSGHVEHFGKKAEVLVSWGGQPQVIRTHFEGGTLIVCSSDYIFSNKSLATDDNGLLAFRILESTAPDGVVFDESLNSSGAPKVFGLLFDPHVRPVTLQILIVTVLFGWWGFRQFGSVLAESESEHRSMTEHAMALGNLHWKSGTGGSALAWYLEYFRNELRLHYAKGSGATEATLLARRAGVDEQETAKLLSEARQLVQQERVSGSRVALLVRGLALIKNKLDHAKGA